MLFKKDISQLTNRDLRALDGSVMIAPFILVIMPLDMDDGNVGRF